MKCNHTQQHSLNISKIILRSQLIKVKVINCSTWDLPKVLKQADKRKTIHFFKQCYICQHSEAKNFFYNILHHFFSFRIYRMNVKTPPGDTRLSPLALELNQLQLHAPSFQSAQGMRNESWSSFNYSHIFSSEISALILCPTPLTGPLDLVWHLWRTIAKG